MESGFTRTSIRVAYGSGVNTRQKRDDVGASLIGGREGAWVSFVIECVKQYSFPLQSPQLEQIQQLRAVPVGIATSYVHCTNVHRLRLRWGVNKR